MNFDRIKLDSMDRVKVPVLKLDQATPVGSPSPLRAEIDDEFSDKENQECDAHSHSMSERSRK